jgi:hypothetical protein
VCLYSYFSFEFFNFRYYSREDAEDAVKYISGTILDDRPIRVDFDWGFEDGRQWGRAAVVTLTGVLRMGANSS